MAKFISSLFIENRKGKLLVSFRSSYLARGGFKDPWCMSKNQYLLNREGKKYLRFQLKKNPLINYLLTFSSA